jgi:hypothetical protein
MRDVLILFLHLIVTIVRLARPGGLRSVVAESLLVKRQLCTLNRGRKRAPSLRATERIFAGLCTLFMNPARVLRSAIVLEAIHAAASPPRAGQTEGPHIVFVQAQASAWPERTE